MRALSIAQPDVTLQLDLDGVIRAATLAGNLADEGLEAWVGRPWVDTVAELGSDKVRRLVADARERSVSGFRQIAQRFPSGREVLVEYNAVKLGGMAGLVAVGKSLHAVTEMQTRLVAAQQEMEREYWKLRELETRYRLLFENSNEAVLLVQVATLRIVEANPAALRALGVAPFPPGVIAGQEFLHALARPDRDALQAMLEQVRVQRRAPGILVRLGRERAPWLVRASLSQSESGLLFLLQFTPGVAALPGLGLAEPVSIENLIERLPDGFVICDGSGLVVRGNRSFFDLIEVDAEDAAVGEPLSRWVGRPDARVEDLLAAVFARGAVRGFGTSLRGEHGERAEVEISAVGDANGSSRYVGALVRPAQARAPSGTRATQDASVSGPTA
jgi:transcriptional regulator PpsR